MKKFTFCLFALFGMTGAINAQTVAVAVDNIETIPGETVTATLNFTCPANTYSGMQIWLTFEPKDGISVQPTGAVTSDLESSKYTFKDGVVNFAATNAASAQFSTSTATVTFTIDESVAANAIYNVTISGQLEGSGVEDAPITGSFNVSMVSLQEVELDEESSTAPSPSDGAVNVKVKRTINANEWSTICLPFDMTSKKVKAAFGDDVKIADLSSWSVEGTWDEDEESVTDVTSIQIVFENVDLSGGLKANHPYMIKVADNIGTFEVKNVIINPQTAKITKDCSVGDGSCSLAMTGVYKMGNITKETLFISNNKLWYTPTKIDGGLKAFRATFKISDVDDLGTFLTSQSRLTMVFGDETTDNIITVQSDGQNGEYYNLNGLRVNTPSKGIYIKNGKKVVVK